MEKYKNKSYYDHMNAFEPIQPMMLRRWGTFEPVTEENIMVPLEYHENGDVTVRMYAKGANEVHVTGGQIAVWHFDIALTNRGNGIWEGVIPASTGIIGNVVLNFIVDGSEAVNPYLPTMFYSGKIMNFIEVDDPKLDICLMRDVPHGAVTREVFWSEAVNQWIRCLVYTPPGYEKGSEYPVLYLQHGGGENETNWIASGKVPYIMDNGIAEGKTKPFIVVMNNGMLRAPGQEGTSDFSGIEGIITKDCREYIESKYRVLTDKWNRAIAGLSMGSMQAIYIGFRNPDLFGSVGSFTYLRCRDADNTYEGNPHLNILKDYDNFWKTYKLFFRSIGGKERNLANSRRTTPLSRRRELRKTKLIIVMSIPVRPTTGTAGEDLLLISASSYLSER